MKLDEARTYVTDSLLHVTSGDFGSAKIDRAIKRAGMEFVRETNCDVGTATISITSGTGASGTNVSASSNVGQTFEVDQFIRAYITASDNIDEVGLVPHKTILRRYETTAGESATARPYWLAFESPAKMLLYPNPDSGYSMTLVHRNPFIDLTAGTTTPAATTLNVPQEYVFEMLEGAAGYLIRGAPGHLDWKSKIESFGKSIEEAKAHFVSKFSGVVDMQTQG